MDSDDGMTHPVPSHALRWPDVPPAQRGELNEGGDALYIWRRDFSPGIIWTASTEIRADSLSTVSVLTWSSEERGEQAHNG